MAALNLVFRITIAILVLVGASSLDSVAAEAETENGRIVSEEPLQISLTYDDWFSQVFRSPPFSKDPPVDLDKARSYYTPAVFKSLNGDADITAERLVYLSDSLKIRGFKVAPKKHPNQLPVVIWCRGGIADFGMVKLGDVMIMTNWARRGYMVLASQYRGSPGSEGRDEDGGADVHDVESLISIALKMPDVDQRNIFLYGYSRGGAMVYETLAAAPQVRAAVVNSGVSDFAAGLRARPDLEATVRGAIPDFEREKASGFISRSAVHWPEKLHAPILILHGTADWRVDPSQALRMAQALQTAHRPYDLMMFSGGSHVYLMGDQGEIDAIILKYFDQHQIL